ncbi:hypothetical protein BGZ83_000196 [Gryganskiella cystojenkinii]|nr:hypothetical protein BGZ83_000196 [Gryganskiella cystojenkinii]
MSHESYYSHQYQTPAHVKGCRQRHIGFHPYSHGRQHDSANQQRSTHSTTTALTDTESEDREALERKIASQLSFGTPEYDTARLTCLNILKSSSFDWKGEIFQLRQFPELSRPTATKSTTARVTTPKRERERSTDQDSDANNIEREKKRCRGKVSPILNQKRPNQQSTAEATSERRPLLHRLAYNTDEDLSSDSNVSIDLESVYEYNLRDETPLNSRAGTALTDRHDLSEEYHSDMKLQDGEKDAGSDDEDEPLQIPVRYFVSKPPNSQSVMKEIAQELFYSATAPTSCKEPAKTAQTEPSIEIETEFPADDNQEEEIVLFEELPSSPSPSDKEALLDHHAHATVQIQHDVVTPVQEPNIAHHDKVVKATSESFLRHSDSLDVIPVSIDMDPFLTTRESSTPMPFMTRAASSVVLALSSSSSAVDYLALSQFSSVYSSSPEWPPNQLAALHRMNNPVVKDSQKDHTTERQEDDDEPTDNDEFVATTISSPQSSALMTTNAGEILRPFAELQEPYSPIVDSDAEDTSVLAPICSLNGISLPSCRSPRGIVSHVLFGATDMPPSSDWIASEDWPEDYER